MIKRRPSYGVCIILLLLFVVFAYTVVYTSKVYRKKTEIVFVKPDKKKMAEQLEKKQRMMNDSFEKAIQFYKGDHVPQDFLKAFEQFEYAATLGHPMSAYYLANMYLEGQGTPPDKKEAFNWMKKAYEGGVKEATFPLAKMYFHGGLWIPRDYFESSRLLHEAADAGDQEAKKFLRMHSDVFGTLKENN